MVELLLLLVRVLRWFTMNFGAHPASWNAIEEIGRHNTGLKSLTWRDVSLLLPGILRLSTEKVTPYNNMWKLRYLRTRLGS